ncbi:hypothetical protein ACFVIY_39485 [Streptomyces sp. NPDC127166]|uniref:hypothetical protein n=1 Tax=Streptomyces sp. NPDC127166 TaxID=3345380 RepID=UPI00362A9FCF
MEPTEQPRVRAVTEHVDAVADAACDPADAVATGHWSPAAVEDAVEVVETIAEALLTERAEVARILVATAALRAALAPPGEQSAQAVSSPCGTQRKGVGHGWTGIR